MEAPINEFLTALTKTRKALLLGGLAVIAHGLSRGTKDADIWLEPTDSAEDWLQAIQDAIRKFPNPLTIHCLPGWQQLQDEDLISSINDVGMVRINGLTIPLDIFREPTGYDISQFGSIWKNAKDHSAGVRLPRAADLIATKELTERERDSGDWFFLLSKARQEQGDTLAKASTAEQARTILEELLLLEADGDPFAKETLEEFG